MNALRNRSVLRIQRKPIKKSAKKSRQQNPSTSDPHKVMRRFGPMVKRVARTIHEKAPFVDQVDLENEGMLSVMQCLLIPETKTPSDQRILKIVERRMGNYALRELAFRIREPADSPRLELVEDHLIDRLDVEDQMGFFPEALNTVLPRLSERHQQTIMMRYGFGDYSRPHTFSEIGRTFGVTVERIRQTLFKAFDRLRIPEIGRELQAMAWVVEGKGDLPWRNFKIPIKDTTQLQSAIEREISRSAGQTLQSLQEAFGLGASEFTHFMERIFPPSAHGIVRGIVRLTEKEKEKLLDEKVALFQSTDRDQAMLNTLKRLENQPEAVVKEEKDSLVGEVQEAFVPVFAHEPERCLELLHQQAQSAENPPEVREIYRRARAGFQRALGRKIPGVQTELDPFQKVDLEIMSRRPANIIGSETGTGKTLEVIAYAKRHQLGRVLILSSKSGANVTWPNEIRKHTNGGERVVVLNSRVIAELAAQVGNIPQGWYIGTYPAATRNVEDMRELGFDLIALDECHRINNDQTQTSNAVTTLYAPHRMGVSAFLYKNRRVELFPLLNWLYPEEFPFLSLFRRQYCQSRQGADRLNYLLAHRMVQRFKREVLRLPRIIANHHSLEMTGVFREEYQAMEADFIAWYQNALGEEELPRRILAGAVLNKMHTLRRKTIEAKQRVIVDILEDQIEGQGRKTGLYTTYIQWAETFARKRKLKRYGICYMDGRTTGEERKVQIEQFNQDPNKRLMIFTAAGGESIELTGASSLVFANKPLTYADEEQAISRLYRRGQIRNVHVHHVFLEDSIEARIEALIERKRQDYERTVRERRNLVRWLEESEQEVALELANQMAT